jgi:hypothetical protein
MKREDLSQRGRDISILSYPLDGWMDGWMDCWHKDAKKNLNH